MNLYDYKILLVDDEETLREMVCNFLQRAGFLHVTVAGSCKEAEAQFVSALPHLVLLDVMLPDGDGFSLLKRLRKNSELPVIFLSARDEDENRLRGLGLGADDYITKPFLPEELILRVTAVLKRVYRIGQETEKDRVIDLGDRLIDLGSGVVSRKCITESNAAGATNENGSEESGVDEKDTEITLTAKEYAIIEKLSENRGRIVTIDALCDAVWREGNFGYENTLIVHIRRLREKIEEDPSHPKHLLTVRGLGYKLV